MKGNKDLRETKVRLSWTPIDWSPRPLQPQKQDSGRGGTTSDGRGSSHGAFKNSQPLQA